jgi:DNA-binding XRE family transcriptional regulator
MDAKRKARLEAAGWKVGDYAEFLGLSPDERALVEMRLELARTIRELREGAGMTQKDLAVRLNTTQPRVVKIEAAASDVSMDVLMRGFLAVGGRVPKIHKPAVKPRLRRTKTTA